MSDIALITDCDIDWDEHWDEDWDEDWDKDWDEATVIFRNLSSAVVFHLVAIKCIILCIRSGEMLLHPLGRRLRFK